MYISVTLPCSRRGWLKICSVTIYSKSTLQQTFQKQMFDFWPLLIKSPQFHNYMWIVEKNVDMWKSAAALAIRHLWKLWSGEHRWQGTNEWPSGIIWMFQINLWKQCCCSSLFVRMLWFHKACGPWGISPQSFDPSCIVRMMLNPVSVFHFLYLGSWFSHGRTFHLP